MLGALATLFNQQGDADAAKGLGVPTVADCYPQQWGPVSCAARFFAVCAARQVGKTDGIRKRARRCLAQPGKRVIYATLIRRNCKKFLWWPILDELAKDGWNVSQANGSDLILTLPNGAWMQALSCSEMGDLKTIRGDQADEFFIDECQEPQDDVVEALVMKIAPSMLMKRGGTLSMWGTVPEVEPCFFSQKLDDPRWTAFGHSFHPDGTERTPAWSTFDNPFIDPEEIQETNANAGLGPGHPIYERETMGRRVRDPSKLAYEFVPVRNVYKPDAVDFSVGQWRHSMGLDLGFQDRDAIVVLAWNRQDGDRRLYERWRWQANHQDVDELADVVKEAIARFHPQYIVGDTGGHGAVKVIETLKNRMGVMIEEKPRDVMVSVGLVNDDLRTGRLMIEEGSELVSDLGKVQRSVNAHSKRLEINKKGYHSDLSEALRYAHHAARHWAAKPPKPEPTLNERREQSWLREQKRNASPWR